jgi:hypothetical protein
MQYTRRTNLRAQSERSFRKALRRGHIPIKLLTSSEVDPVPITGAPPTAEEYAAAQARNPVPWGCCWNCHAPHSNLWNCWNCGRSQPIGEWSFPPVRWFEWSADDDLLVFGEVAFHYDHRWLRSRFVLREPDQKVRRKICELVDDPAERRKGNREICRHLVRAVLGEWQHLYGGVE